MKILLLGEYSSVHNNLAVALRRAGHDVTLANDGDFYKNYNRDVDLGGKGKNILLRNMDRIRRETGYLFNASGFDIVQIMSPMTLSRFGATRYLHRRLKSRNGKLFFLAAGDDYYYWKAFRTGIYKYSPHQGTLNDFKADTLYYENRRSERINGELLEMADGVISCAAEYHIAYKDVAGNKLRYIPFPVDIIENIVKPVVQKPYKILHGIQHKRMGFKGSQYFIDAMKQIAGGNDGLFEYKEVFSLPYAVYKKELQSCDILFDQVNSYSPGLNAVEAMSYGKVVFGGCEDEFMALNSLTTPPLVNVRPDLAFTANAILEVLRDEGRFNAVRKQARAYVENNHNADRVAQQYVDFWTHQ